MRARNVFNVDSVDRLVERVAAQAATPAVALWLRRTARRWILTQYQDVRRLVIEPGSARVLLRDPAAAAEAPCRVLADDVARLPDWCANALRKGDEIVYLRLDATLDKRLRRLAAFLDEAYGDGGATKLNRLAFPAAEKALRKWRKERWTERRRMNGAEPVFRGSDGVRIYRLHTAENLHDEGARMGHCVASYADDIAEGRCEIYSLRNAAGTPRATIEVVDGRVVQVKGYANLGVDFRLRQHVRTFIRVRGYDLDGDLVHVGQYFGAGRNLRQVESFLRSVQCESALSAYVYSRSDAMGRADVAGLISSLADWSVDLSPEARQAMHDALLPQQEGPVRLRRIATYHVYDAALPVYRADTAVVWLSLAANDAFKGVPGARDRYVRLRDRAERRLASLAFEPADRLYLLGRREADELDVHRGWLSPADVVSDATLDVFPSIRRRHERLRRLVNRHKAQSVGRRGAASEAHRDFRRILDGAWREMVI